ncbi:M20/M25/M40 family metallo-hydrolase [Streptomyces sp. CL12-4]|uniref:M20/M25/M40 family metallo-hydrolase n=1 Tax=Streptomyces sp. CL12-4 TaxID=2810306 RepID=UPI0035AC22CD
MRGHRQLPLRPGPQPRGRPRPRPRGLADCGVAEFVVDDHSGAALPGLSHPAAAAFIEAVGGTPQPKYGWTDVSRFSALGVPAVNYGPGNPHLAHKRDERVETAKILAGEERLRSWLTA